MPIGTSEGKPQSDVNLSTSLFPDGNLEKTRKGEWKNIITSIGTPRRMPDKELGRNDTSLALALGMTSSKKSTILIKAWRTDRERDNKREVYTTEEPTNESELITTVRLVVLNGTADVARLEESPSLLRYKKEVTEKRPIEKGTIK